jgi:hypothetical protein
MKKPEPLLRFRQKRKSGKYSPQETPPLFSVLYII